MVIKKKIIKTYQHIFNVENPIEPHNNPEPNDFGKGAARNYDGVKKLLNI